ncbi:MAG: magnesium transporter CorA [Lachnospiraceae bacterium]|nr:magnesium transporter CorA [Lachnospiraceae bacterium]
MKTYLIKEILTECEAGEIRNAKEQFVAVLTAEEWREKRDVFDMGIDIERNPDEIYTTKAEVNYDSLAGTFSIPDRNNILENSFNFSFVLDERGILFIGCCEKVEKHINEIIRTKKWRLPGLERFIYDFLEQIVWNDQSLLEKYEKELDRMEDDIMESEDERWLSRANEIRREIRELRMHYEQMIDLGQEFEENENNFFKHENLRYFRLFIARIERLRDIATFTRDYSVQVRELYESRLEIRQNRIMTLLTIITTIFMPLTLIAGWYGMNFRYMPELDSVWGYPIVILVSLLIIAGSLLYFKKKKWL